MNTIARTIIATVLAAPVVAVQPAAANSVVRVHSSNTAGFDDSFPACRQTYPGWPPTGQHRKVPCLFRRPAA